MSRHSQPSLICQIDHKLNSMVCFGKSRHDAKKARRAAGEKYPCRTHGIYSINTLKYYKRQCCLCAKWIKKRYKCKSLEDMRKYVFLYLQYRVDSFSIGLSAWTIHLDFAALSKLYDCGMQDWGINKPLRRRQDIKRSRNVHINNTNYNGNSYIKKVKDFVCATGLRLCEVIKLCPENISSDGHFILNVKGKGGKIRNVEVLGGRETFVRKIADEAIAQNQKKLFPHIPRSIDMHACRRKYAQLFYEQCVKTGRTEYHGPKKPIYICKKDFAGTTYIRGAMLEVSKQLGHNRESVIALSYLNPIPSTNANK